MLFRSEERKRQLYVAMTRAEDRLIMTGIAEGKREKTLDELSWLKQLLQIYENDSVVEIKTIAVKEKTVSDLEQLSIQELDNEQLAFISPLSSYDANSPRSFSPSSLQTYLHCPRQFFYQYVMGLPSVDGESDVDASAEKPVISSMTASSNSNAQATLISSLSAKDLGSVIHRALELYKGDLDAALAQAIKENAPLYEGDEARKMLEGYLASDLYKRIPKKQLREQAFTLYAENGIVISGIIDCLAFKPDGSLLIVDYKTGRPPLDGEPDVGYAYQLAIYEKVVREIGRAHV